MSSLFAERKKRQQKKLRKKNPKKEESETYPEDLRLKNLTTIRAIVADLLKTIDITPYFKKPLDDTWQPEKWVVDKLQKRFNLSKKFIFDEIIFRPFINYHSSTEKNIPHYNTLYFHWVIKRFKFIHSNLIKEKTRLEKIIDEKK